MFVYSTATETFPPGRRQTISSYHSLTPPNPTPPKISYHHRGTVPHVIMTLAREWASGSVARARSKENTAAFLETNNPQEEKTPRGGRKSRTAPPPLFFKVERAQLAYKRGQSCAALSKKVATVVFFFATGGDGRRGGAGVRRGCEDGDF